MVIWALIACCLATLSVAMSATSQGEPSLSLCLFTCQVK